MEEVTFLGLGKDGYGELEEKKSRFLAVAHTVSDEKEAAAFLDGIRKANPGSRHNVWAYVLRNGAVRCSDDGEPQGTGGVPLLEILKKSGVTDAMLVVTRYFGGILLGTGGLSRAYSGAARLAFDDAGLKTLSEQTDFTLPCRYDDYQKILAILPKFGVTVLSTDFGDGVLLSLSVPSSSYPAFCGRITEMSAGRLEPAVTGKHLG